MKEEELCKGWVKCYGALLGCSMVGDAQLYDTNTYICDIKELLTSIDTVPLTPTATSPACSEEASD